MAIGKLDNNLNTRSKTTAPRDSKSTMFEILMTWIAELANRAQCSKRGGQKWNSKKSVCCIYLLQLDLKLVVHGLGFGLLFKSLWAYYLNI